MSESIADPRPICGVIMPISASDGCSEAHWSDVLRILSDSIDEAGFEANIVSNADEVGIIQKRIIQNLYDNPVVVCDVSSKNANVMFELGIRLAFDKPTIIIKDDRTSYSFDTSPIEHLEYPRDLRFSKIVEFKEKLTDKIRSTHEKANKDPNYTTFLKHFGEFTVAKLDKKEVSGQEFILEELKSLRRIISTLDYPRSIRERERVSPTVRLLDGRGRLDICVGGRNDARIADACELASSLPGVSSVRIKSLSDDHKHIVIELDPDTTTDPQEIKSIVRSRVGPSAKRASGGPSKDN